MNDNILISIVIPVYNNKGKICRCIESIVNQSYKNIELIIVDGGSSDGTLDEINRYKECIRTIISEPDKGIYDAMNKGKAIATGDFILYLGSDDLLPSYYSISDIVSRMREEYVIYYGDVYARKKHQLYYGKFTNLTITQRNLCHQSIFYPKIIYKNYDYSLEYKIFSDYEYNLKVFALKEVKKKYLPVLVCIFNDYDGISSCLVDDNFMNDRLRIVKRNYNIVYWFILLVRLYIFKKIKNYFKRSI